MGIFGSILKGLGALGATALGGPVAGALVGGALGGTSAAIERKKQMEKARKDAEFNASLIRDSYLMPENMNAMRKVDTSGSLWGNVLGQGVLGAQQGASVGKFLKGGPKVGGLSKAIDELPKLQATGLLASQSPSMTLNIPQLEQPVFGSQFGATRRYLE